MASSLPPCPRHGPAGRGSRGRKAAGWLPAARRAPPAPRGPATRTRRSPARDAPSLTSAPGGGSPPGCPAGEAPACGGDGSTPPGAGGLGPTSGRGGRQSTVVPNG
eukprot:3039258-Heterocapsa_arctica.AAC.1